MLNNIKTLLTSLKYLFLIFVFVFGLITVISSGGGGDDSSDSSDTTDNSTDNTTYTSQYDPDNLPYGPFFTDTAYDLGSPTDITLNTTTITVTGPGASANGSKATITASGTYNIHGTLTDGQIIVNVDNTTDTGDVSLYLNGINITCSNSAPIEIESAERVIIALADQTDNFLTDGNTYTALDEDGDLIDSTIYSKEDLVIYGEGSLTVDANYNNGIKSKDGLIIHSGNIDVASVDDGIIGKNYISIEGGDIFVYAYGDGLKSTNSGDITQGYIYVDDGSIDVICGADAIQVETHIVIDGGDFDLFTAGGYSASFNEDLYTAKGLKAPIGVTVYDGNFTIDSADDSIHSNDTIVIHGGGFELASGDDAIHGDLALTINNPETTVNVSTCYEGIESLVITINDGDIHVFSSDDPINATDGSGNMMSTVGELYINGGYIYLECVNADGFDSNGSVAITGGEIIINGPVTGGNGILDYGSFKMTGGFMLGAGTSDMAQAPGGGSSTQNALLLLFSQKTAGTLFHIEKSDGTDIVTFMPAKAYASVVLSSSSLVTGTTYKVFFDGSYTGGSVKDGLYTGGTYSGGTEDTTLGFTVSSLVTQVGTGTGGGRGFPMP